MTGYVVPTSIRPTFLTNSRVPSLRRQSGGETPHRCPAVRPRSFSLRPGVEPGPTMPCSSSYIRRRCPRWRQSLTRASRSTFEGKPGTGVEPALPCTPAGIRQPTSEGADKTTGETQHFSRCSPFPHSAPSFSFYNSTASIRAIERSASSCPEANAEITSNTWSEKPPMFKMSARSTACVVWFG